MEDEAVDEGHTVHGIGGGDGWPCPVIVYWG